MPCVLAPGHEGPSGELRAVIGAHGQRIASEDGRQIRQPGHALAQVAPDRDAHALVAEVIGQRQPLGAPPGAQTVADEAHAPHFADAPRQLQRHALRWEPLGLFALAHRQIGGAVEPIDALGAAS